MENSLFPELEDYDPARDNIEREFEHVIEMVQTSHNLSIKQICEYMKTYRPWVSKYILPYLDKVYLPNGRRYKTNKRLSSLDWPYYLYTEHKIPTLESSWYNRQDFVNLLKKNLVSITRRTISVSKTFLIEKNKRDIYKSKYTTLMAKRNDMIREKKWNLVVDINEELDLLDNQYLGKECVKAIKNCDETKRTSTQEIEVPNCNWDYKEFKAVHDMKGYGGIDETIYRKLFTSGAIRLEFSFISKKGDIGKKIFYYYDKEDLKYDLADGIPLVTLPYDFFLSKILPNRN